MTGNRVMRCNNNPAKRGFIVRVLEETHRDELGQIHFKTVASSEHGTKRAADRAYAALKAEYIGSGNNA